MPAEGASAVEAQEPGPEPLRELPALAEGALALLTEVSSRLVLLPEGGPGDGGVESVEVGQPFEWRIECSHPAGGLPVLLPEPLDGPAGPLTPDRGWSLIEGGAFVPQQRLPDGRYRSRARLIVAALEQGRQTTETGRRWVPRRELPSLGLDFRLDALGVQADVPTEPTPGGGRGQAPLPAGAPALLAPESAVGLLRVSGPSLEVRSLLGANESGPRGLEGPLEPAPRLAPLIAWRRSVAIALCSLAGCFLALRGFLKPQDFPPPIAPPPSAEARLATLRGALEARPGSPPPREVYYELSVLLRSRLGERHGLGLPGQTDEEWVRTLAAVLSETERIELERLVRRLGRAKYGAEALSPWAALELLEGVEGWLQRPEQAQ